MKYINFHTHHPDPSPDVIPIHNLLNTDQYAKTDFGNGYYSIGIHPWYIHPEHWLEDALEAEKYISHKHVLAIGEAGLDRMTDLPMNLQVEVFKKMVFFSEKAKKPIIIHSVRSHAEILLLHKEADPKQAWIIHGFNLRLSIAEAFIQQGFYFSFGSAILHHKSAASLALTSIPSDRILLETDDKPVTIQEIYKRAAQLRNLTEEETKEIIYANFKKLTGYERS